MEEREIVRSILAGNTQDYKMIVERYSKVVFGKIMALAKNQEDAKELTQQTFVRAYTRLECWRGENMGAWLCTIGLHLTLNSIDKAKRHRTEQIDAHAVKIDESDAQERELLLQKMEKAISALTEQEQNIIRMHYYKGYKTDRIASQTGLSKGNVLVKLHRIREKIKKGMSDERDRR